MNDVNEIVSFIEEEMDFYSYVDFFRNARALKRLYRSIDIRTKKLYKWYVYSREIPLSYKNKIWDYLNGEISLGELTVYDKSK